MYNFSVEDWHTYFVGEEKFLVHNAKCVKNADGIVEVPISKSKYPESAQHIEDAIATGHPDVLTIDRGGAAGRRSDSLRGHQRQPGLDRDEYPPAMSREGGGGASVRGINPSDNRGSGSTSGHGLRDYPDGTQYTYVIED